jgi:hypothetical protein
VFGAYFPTKRSLDIGVSYLKLVAVRCKESFFISGLEFCNRNRVSCDHAIEIDYLLCETVYYFFLVFVFRLFYKATLVLLFNTSLNK